jgi:hypothetical protein
MATVEREVRAANETLDWAREQLVSSGPRSPPPWARIAERSTGGGTG